MRLARPPATPPARLGPRRLRVLAAIGDQLTGVNYVRFFQPFEHLRELGIDLATLGASLTLVRTDRGLVPDPHLLDGAGLVMFPQMVASPLLPDGTRLHVVDPLCRAARERGIPVAYSVDDHLQALDPHNPSYEVVEEGAENLRALVERSDAYVVTTEALAAALGGTGKPVHVLPNAVDPRRWPRRRHASRETIVGWAGSASHLDDLRMVLPAVRAAQKRAAFHFVLYGVTSRRFDAEVKEIQRNWRGLSGSRLERAEAFLDLVGELRTIRHRHVPFVNMVRHFETLPALDLDLGLCPLLDTPFNRGKSALKFYEYAVTETATLASAVPPYVGELDEVVPNEPAVWAEAIERLAVDKAARDAALARQREFVLAERSIGRLRDRWAAVLLGIAGGAAAAASQAAADLNAPRPR